ncbi:MAG: sugar ABC transporter permease [Candidatus Atribacteria bacterium]|nr:sugar ABC transporter permease [Candidatus Atribacteria bacterium]
MNRFVSRATLFYERYFHFIILLPSLIIIIILTLYPLINVLYLSFHRYSYITGTKYYVGLVNFIRIFNDRYFLKGLENTLKFSFFATFFELLAGFGLALLFNLRFRGKKYLLPIVILPMMLSTMVISATWRAMYHYDYGIINYILKYLGIGDGVKWLIDRNIAMGSVIIVDIWQWTPFAFLILLAGLRSIPDDLHEAARVDGAGAAQVFRHITLPLLKSHILMVVLLRTIDTLRIFDKVYALTRGGPGTATVTMSYYIYREGFTYFNLGRASAASVIMLVVVIIVSSLYIGYVIRGQARG